MTTKSFSVTSEQVGIQTELDAFRQELRHWCRSNVPGGWRTQQSGASEADFVGFQREWFQTLRRGGFAVPHWPAEWGGGMSTAQQVVLYQELAAYDAPRLVLAFVSIHHAASTLLLAGTAEQRAQHLPAILDGEIWCQGFSEPDAGSDLASLSTRAEPVEGGYVVNGQKVWASGAAHSDWCLLLARTDPDVPKRKGISYFVVDMGSSGIDVRPTRQATGDQHFCEIFLQDVFIPESGLLGSRNDGWRVAQSTLSAERGMTMLELAERLGHSGFGWLVDACGVDGPEGRPIEDPVVQDRLAAFECELTALRAICRDFVDRNEAGATGPADASIVKLYYSELLQRLTDFGAEIVGVAGHRIVTKPRSSGWESGVWPLDFIGSWEWTIPGGSSEIQRTIIGERGLGLPREPVAS